MSTLMLFVSDLLTHLQAQTYSETVTFSDTIIPRKKVEQMGSTITGTVFPSTNARERENRSCVTPIYGTTIAVSKKVTPSDDAEVDGLVTLVEEIAASLDGLLVDNGNVTEVLIDPVFDFDRLRENNVFTSLVRVTARGS